MNQPLQTTVMGSYPQPRWLVHEDRLRGDGVPRVRHEELWRVEVDHLPEAIEAACLLAIADQEAAGVDIITDGEVGRESYFNHFANSLGGVAHDRVGQATNRRGGVAEVPLVTGPVRRERPIEAAAARFLRSHTNRQTKVTVPGPFTLSQLAQNDFYPDQRSLALAYAAAVNEELHDLADAGIDVVQIDEPYLQANAESAREFAAEVIAAAVEGVSATTTLHTCFGYAAYVENKTSGYPFLDELAEIPVDFVAIETAQPNLTPEIVKRLAPRSVVLGVVDLGREDVESVEEIATRIRAALEHTEPERLAVAPDCGMKYLPRELARAKLTSMVAAANLVRSEL